MTPTELFKAIDVNKATYQRKKKQHGKLLPTETLLLIADELNVPMDVLMGRKEYHEPITIGHEIKIDQRCAVTLTKTGIMISPAQEMELTQEDAIRMAQRILFETNEEISEAVWEDVVNYARKKYKEANMNFWRYRAPYLGK